MKTMLSYIENEYETNKEILKNTKLNLDEILKINDIKSYKRWVIIATGSSANSIEASKYYVEKILKIKIDIEIPSTFTNYIQFIDEKALYIAVSQGGSSTSIIEAVRLIRSKNISVVGLTGNVKSLLANECDVLLNIGCGEELVGYVTKGVSATILSFMLLGLELSKKIGIIDNKKYNNEMLEFKSVVNEINNMIMKGNCWYDNNKDDFKVMNNFTVIGHGPGYGVVKEAHTKIEETVRKQTNGYELEEYMHGPYLALNSDSNIFFIETNSNLKNRQKSLEEYLHKYSKNIYVISDMNESNDKKVLSLDIVYDELKLPLLMVIPVQILSYRLSEDIGNNLNKKIYEDFDEVLKSKIY